MLDEADEPASEAMPADNEVEKPDDRDEDSGTAGSGNEDGGNVGTADDAEEAAAADGNGTGLLSGSTLLCPRTGAQRLHASDIMLTARNVLPRIIRIMKRNLAWTLWCLSRMT